MQQEAKDDLYRRFSDRGLRRERGRRLIIGLTVNLMIRILSGVKRALDVVAAAVLLSMLSPLMAAAFFLGGRELRRTPRVGRWCEPFDQLSFPEGKRGLGSVAALLRLHALPALFNILKGDMSFIGPRPVSPGDLSPRERAARKRYDVRPGLICLWWLRRRANIAFGNEVESDGEYIDTQTVWGDVGIALRAIPAIIYGEGAATAAEVVSILGVRINNLTMSEAVESILKLLNGNRPSQVCFFNADCANIAYGDAEYKTVLNEAELTLADGIGLKLAGKFLSRDIKQNVNGTDLFPSLCAALSGTVHGLFLLGAKPGVAETVRDWIHHSYPEVIVSGCHHGYFTPEEETEVIRQIAGSGAAMLLVAFGAPRQDKWINRNLGETGVRVAIGVGGLFDFYSGNVPRAPQWLREMGLEWFYRFMQEPGRLWRRYFLGNAVFLFRVFKERKGQTL
jgi:N-acetylglucosaminyldiphosphoundecaprenol N-acetyl-beta-D-mannosaminyltransferase